MFSHQFQTSLYHILCINLKMPARKCDFYIQSDSKQNLTFLNEDVVNMASKLMFKCWKWESFSERLVDNAAYHIHWLFDALSFHKTTYHGTIQYLHIDLTCEKKITSISVFEHQFWSHFHIIYPPQEISHFL